MILVAAIQNGEFLRLLEKLRLEKEDISEASIENIASGLFDISDDLPTTEGKLDFKSEVERELARTVAQLVSRIKDQHTREQMVEQLVRSTSALTGPMLFTLLVEPNEIKPRPIEEQIVSTDCIKLLKEILVERMWEFANSGQLWRLKLGVNFLYQLSDWESEESVHTWLANEIQDSKKAGMFIYQMLSVSTLSGGASGSRRIYTIHPLSWQKLLNLKQLLESVKNHSYSEPIETAIKRLGEFVEMEAQGNEPPKEVYVISQLDDESFEENYEDSRL